MATIQKRGPKSFQARVRHKGYPTLTATFDTHAQANAWAREKEREIDRGTLPDTLEAHRTLLSDCIEDYRKTETPYHRGAEIEDLRLRKLAEHPIASLPLAKITKKVIKKYIKERKKSVSDGTVLRELGVLRQVLTFAYDEDKMIHDPFKGVKKPKKPPSRDRRLHTKEKENFNRAFRKTRNVLFKFFVRITEETGMRRGEHLSIEWSQVFLEDRIIALRADQTKNGEARDVPLTLKAVRLLIFLQKKSGNNQFVYEGLTRDAIKHCWSRLIKRANISNFRLHDLRHERATSLIEAGWNLMMAMNVTGHKDTSAFRGYVHVNTKTVIKELDKL